MLARQAADLIERTLAELALSSVGQRLIEAHEEERARIARELHDDINQRLALVNVRLGKGSADVRQEIVGLMADIQALSHGLHPAKLDILGLEKAAAGCCDELARRHGVTIDLQVENIPEALPREISLCLYRVLQEALQNIVKHSASGHAKVSLNGQRDTLSLIVKDSGAGFDARAAMRGPGLGLTSMKERLKAIGGQLSIESGPRQGTMIHAIAPLKRQ